MNESSWKFKSSRPHHSFFCRIMDRGCENYDGSRNESKLGSEEYN